MVGHSSANDDSLDQVHRTTVGDQEDESTSSTAEESAPSSPSIQNCQQRSAPCRLFIASADQLQQPRCVICGFHELDHLVRVLHRRPPTAAPQPVSNSSGQKHSSSQDNPSAQSLSNGVLPRHCGSDWNVFENDAPKSEKRNKNIPAQWRNSYDVRGEYLSKEDFRAKYSSYFQPASATSGKSEDASHRKFYYHHPPTASSVYYYTDRGRINDSGGDTDVEQKRQKDCPIPAYWSDSEAGKQPAAATTDPFPLITFRPPNAAKTVQQRHSASFALSLTNPLKTLLSQELSKRTLSPMLGQKQEVPEVPPRRSAFVDYKATFNAKNSSEGREPRKPRKKPSSGAAGVSFHQQTAIIGNDGGAEHFLNSDSSDSTLGDENGNEEVESGQEDEVIWTLEPKTDFEKLTEINTEFNSNRKNFVSEDSKEKADAAVLVSVTVRPPPAASAVSNSLSLASEESVSVEIGTQCIEPSQPVPVPPTVDYPQPPTQPVPKPPVIKPDRESTPVYAPIRKFAPPPEKAPIVALSASKKSELDEKLQRMARDLETVRIGATPPPKAKGPAPLPPPISAAPIPANRFSGMLKKSYSAFVVPTPSPGLNASTTDLMTTSVNGMRQKGLGSEMEMMARSLSQDRCSSVDVSSRAAADEAHSAIAKGKGTCQARNFFNRNLSCNIIRFSRENAVAAGSASDLLYDREGASHFSTFKVVTGSQ